ncbi:hypothetical protein BDV12DRAFT_191811 [Aspergillus spectabilis]
MSTRQEGTERRERHYAERANRRIIQIFSGETPRRVASDLVHNVRASAIRTRRRLRDSRQFSRWFWGRTIPDDCGEGQQQGSRPSERNVPGVTAGNKSSRPPASGGHTTREADSVDREENDARVGRHALKRTRITILENPVRRVDDASPSPSLGTADPRSTTPPPHPSSPHFLESDSSLKYESSARYNLGSQEAIATGEGSQRGEQEGDPPPDNSPSEPDSSSHESKSSKTSNNSQKGRSSDNGRPPDGCAPSGNSGAPGRGRHPEDGRPPDGGEPSNHGRPPHNDTPSKDTRSRNLPPEFFQSLSAGRLLKLPTSFPEAVCSRVHPVSEAPSSHYCTGMMARVWITKDGVPFVFHDSTLDCFGESKHPERLSWDELMKLKNKSPKFTNVNLITLTDLLNKLGAMQTQCVVAYLDIKSNRNPQIVAKILDKVLNATPRHQTFWRHRVVVFIPNIESLPVFGVPLAGYKMVVKCESLDYAQRIVDKHPLVQFRFEPDILITLLGQAFVAESRQLGRDVYVGTVNSQAQMKWCIRVGVKGIITDVPGSLVGLYWDYQRNQAPWKDESMQTLLSHAMPQRERLVPPNSRAIAWVQQTYLKTRLSFHRLKSQNVLSTIPEDPEGRDEPAPGNNDPPAPRENSEPSRGNSDPSRESSNPTTPGENSDPSRGSSNSTTPREISDPSIGSSNPTTPGENSDPATPKDNNNPPRENRAFGHPSDYVISQMLL